MNISLTGEYVARISDGKEYRCILPGSLDENQIGFADVRAKAWHPDENSNAALASDNGPIATRFTRKYIYEGAVSFSKDVKLCVPEGKRAFIDVERARLLSLKVDGTDVPSRYPVSLSTPYIFDITDAIAGQNSLGEDTIHSIEFISDNSYPGLPKTDICYSSAATDETQTNWNGLIGDIRLRIENPTFIESVQIYPVNNRFVDIRVNISAVKDADFEFELSSLAFKNSVKEKVNVTKGDNTLYIEDIPLIDNVKLWDIDEPDLYELSVTEVSDGSASFEKSEKTYSFGVRDFTPVDGRLAVNGRKIFLRQEANCAEFPETGHPPMTVEEWETVLKMYASYGVNCVRFHSNCPPDCAFTAADRIGILMQPELSNWNPRDAFESEESVRCYDGELMDILRELANHPSFVMLTLGNELHASEKGHERMHMLLNKAREYDSTRLYADASNCHYGHLGCDAESDFYTACACESKRLRGSGAGMSGFINQEYPDALHNYNDGMEYIRKTFDKPVFEFEVGQYEVLPDFNELELFKGISIPANLELIKTKAKNKGMLEKWPLYVSATGELSRLSYKEEVLASMRTKEMSGISLLGLQDFPGQGTALVGMLNSHLVPKSFDFAKPERFKEFFRDELILLELVKFTYESGEKLEVNAIVANYGKNNLKGNLIVTAESERNSSHISASIADVTANAGQHTEVGKISLDLSFVNKSDAIKLTASLDGVNTEYTIWVYSDIDDVCPCDVIFAEDLNEYIIEKLNGGAKVFLSLSEEALTRAGAIKANYTTDFWSVGTFPSQTGCMGQLIDNSHPVFDNFPTSFHTDKQWWPMAVEMALITDGKLADDRHLNPIITEMDSYAYMRNMFQLAEFNCGNGKIVVSTMKLQNNTKYVEVRALLSSIYSYMSGDKFTPKDSISLDELKKLINMGE